MVDIESVQDLLCNVKEAMKNVFMPRDELDTTYSKTNHTHPVDSSLSGTSTNPVQNKVVKTALDGKAATVHSHNSNDITGLSSLLSDKADVDHNHDARYYTETEVDTKLNGKANTAHTHDDRYYTETEVDTKLASKAASSHTHDDRYFTETEVTSKLAGKSDTTHNHNGVYPAIADFNNLSAKVKKTDAIRVRLIRADSNFTPYSQDTELSNEGTFLDVNTGDKLGARLYTTDSSISLNNRNVTIFIGSTVKQTTTNANGITKEMVGLNNGQNAMAYAILKGTEDFNKSIDIKYVNYQ